MMDRPFPIVDGDGHVTETDEQVRRYMPEPFRSSLERMDEKWELRGAAEAPELKRPPTEYVRDGRWYFHTEAGEKMLPYVMSVIGEDNLFYASDFPHWDSHYPQSIDEMLSRDDISAVKRKVMGENALRLCPRFA